MSNATTKCKVCKKELQHKKRFKIKKSKHLLCSYSCRCEFSRFVKRFNRRPLACISNLLLPGLSCLFDPNFDHEAHDKHIKEKYDKFWGLNYRPEVLENINWKGWEIISE